MGFKKNSTRLENSEAVAPFIYGPVLSRRLGISLGIDILPPKTCNLNCIYCQLGPTRKKVEVRHPYFRLKDIIQAIRNALERVARIDYLTFSGSGEPTLNAHLGALIRQIKKMTSKPVAVLTNSLLLGEKEVRKELAEADLTVPSLDAAEQSIFLQINRPSPSIYIDQIIEGLIHFREDYRNKVWLEIMLVKEVNDDLGHLEKLKEAADRIRPDKIQLNTAVRPPAESWVQPLETEELIKAAKIFGSQAEIVIESIRKVHSSEKEDLEDKILSILKRRPASLDELVAILSKDLETVSRALDRLTAEQKIKSRRYYHRLQYEYQGKVKKDERTS